MNRWFTFVGFWFFCLAIGFAQVKARLISSKPFPVYFYELENGLKVFLSPNPAEPNIYTAIAVRAGSAYDPPDNTGLAHYLEHLLFKGTDEIGTLNYEAEKPYLDQIEALYEAYNRATDSLERLAIYKRIDSVAQIAAKYAIPNEYDRMVANLGAQGTNAFTSYDQTVYINLIPSNQLEKWLMIESERFRDPVITRLFHTELEAVCEEKNISLDEDDDQLFEKVMAELFPAHPYGQQTPIGTIEHLKNPSIKKIKAYLHKYYVPGNMAIILAGDLDVEKTIDLIETYFGNYPSRPVPERPHFDDPPLTTIRTVELYGPQPEEVLIAFKLPGATSEWIPHINLVSDLLINDKTGLMDVELIQKQAVLSVDLWTLINRDYTALFLFGEPRQGQSLEEVKSLLIEQIEKLKEGQFDESLFQAIIRNYEVQMTRSYLENPSRVFEMVDAYTNGVPWEKYVANFEQMRTLTKDDIVQFARTYLNHYVVGYKRKGEREVPKIVKPPITPLQVNRDTMSLFFQSLQQRKEPPLEPHFFDPSKSVVKAQIHPQVPLVYVPNEENALFTVYWRWEFGSLADPVLPIAYEYLKVVGTQRESNEAIQKRFFNLACDWEWEIQNEEMTLTLTGPSVSFQEALALLFQLFSQTAKDKDALSKLKERILKEREDALNDPNQIAEALFDYSMYGKDSPYKRDLSNAELKQLTVERVIQSLRSLFSYPHEIGYYGPLSLSEAKNEFQPYYQDRTFRKTLPKWKPLMPLQVKKTTVYLTHFPDMVQATLYWYIPGNRFDRDQIPIVMLFNEYFGGGMSGIVFQEIREAKALAYATFASVLYSPKPYDRFCFFAFVGTQADKLPDAIQAMNALLTDFPVSSKVYSTAVNSLEQTILSTRFLRESKITHYFYLKELNLNQDIYKIVYERLPSYSLETVRAYHRAYLQGKPYALSVVGDPKRLNLAYLKSLGQVKVVPKNELFGY